MPLAVLQPRGLSFCGDVSSSGCGKTAAFGGQCDCSVYVDLQGTKAVLLVMKVVGLWPDG